ncbi:MAG: hypothetical protein SFY68_10175, partial [Candidatus Sumerlaeia bacterium]|nr:hypothetical protein [Candidatus Sumerlaeia bacterium]
AGIFYGPGLGSYTTSLVCSLLSITGIDPFQLGTHPLTLNDVSRQMTIRVAPHQRARAEQVLQELLGRNCFTPHRWRESTLEEARVQAADLLGLSTELRDTLLNTRNWELYAGRERLSPAGQEPSAQWLFNDPRTLAWLCRKLKGLPKSPEPEVGVHGLAESQSVIPLFVTTPNTGQKSEKTSREVRHSHWSSAQCAALGAGVIRLVEEPALELLAVATHWIRLEGHDQFTPEDALNRQSARIWDALQTDSMRGIPFLEAPGFRIFVGQKRPRTLGQLIAALKDWDEAHGLYTVESELVERAMLALLCLAVKLEHPIAFAAGLLTMISGDPKRLQAHIHEQLLLGREIRPLDINCSSPWWSPEGNALRAGLCQVRALDSDALSEIELVRQELAYGNLRDLMQRTDASALSAEQVEALIHAGAFDSLEHNRTQLIQHFQRLRPLLRPKTLPRSATRFEEFFNPSTTSILHQHTQILELGPVYKNAAAEITAEQQLQQERSATSVYLSVSPCYFFADLLREARILTTLPAKRKTHRPIISLIGPLTPIDPCPPRSDVFAYAEIGTSLVRINQQQWHQLHDTFAETDLVLVTGPLHEKLICLETLRIDHPESAQRHSIEAEALRLQPFTFQPAQAKALLELFKAYPGSTAVQWPWLDAKPPRLQQKLTARRITWCPALEVELRSILKDGEWALHSTRAFTATESPDLEPTGTG